MIVISNALPKSASTILYEYTHDLIVAAFPENGNDELIRRCNTGDVEGVHAFVKNYGGKNLRELQTILKDFGPFVVKTHRGLDHNLRYLVESGKAKVTIIHRDPRDVVISAVDHCKMTAGSDFTPFHLHDSLEASYPLVKKWIPRVIEWLKYGNCLELRYVDLVTEPEHMLAKIVGFLGLSIGREQIASIVQGRVENKNHMFNTGKVLRFSDELSDSEIEMLTEGLHDEILALGYEL